MNESKSTSLLSGKVDNRLARIANVLLLNASFIDNIGLLNGKMGIAIFFYYYGRYTGSKMFEDYAGELIDEVYEEISTKTPVGFAIGLTGIGWGIEYLVMNKFIEADTDEALSEIDNAVYRSSLYRPFLLENGNDIFGYGQYYIARLREHGNDDDNLKTLFKKQHLIYLTDDCERILVQKKFLDFNISSLGLDTINSLAWFLLEMHRLGLFPAKVGKVLHSLPEYLEDCLKSPDDKPGHDLLLCLTEKIIPAVGDKELQKELKKIVSGNNGSTYDIDKSDDVLVNDFIKNTWQQLVYIPYIISNKSFQDNSPKFFSIIDNEENWNQRLNALGKDNMGLTGLAGLGLGLLFYTMKEELRTTKSEIRMENIN